MNRFRNTSFLLAFLLAGTLVVGAAGCGGDVQDGIPDLAEMSEPDRSAALKQAVCPVSRQTLGSMGTPVKVSIDGREVFLCCAGCEEQLRREPERYFSVLEAAVPE